MVMDHDVEWKPIPGENPAYEVGSNGEIRVTRDGVTTPMKLNLRDRYYQIVLYRRGHGKVTYYVHRLIAQVFVANPDNLPYVNHKDGNRLNNRADNLEWCTALENHWHALDHGIGGLRGIPLRRVTDSDISVIRSKMAAGSHTLRELAAEYGVSTTFMSRVRKGAARGAVPIGNPSERFRTKAYHRVRRAEPKGTVGQR